MSELYIFSQDDVLLTTLTESTGLVSTWFKDHLNRVPDEPFVFTVEAHTEEARYVLDENQVVFRDKEGDLRLFVIKELDEIDNFNGPQITASCEPAFMELKEHIVEDRRIINQKANIALDAALENTRWNGEVTVELGLATTNFYYTSSIDSVWKILEIWGGDFKDIVHFEGNRITKRTIEIVQRKGEDRGHRFEIDHNLEEIQRTVISYPLTALYGRGGSIQTEGGGNSRYIDFSDVEWKVVNGDPVDKPIGRKWVGDPDALRKYGRAHENKLLHREGIFSDQDYEDPEELLHATWNHLKQVKKPEVNYRMSIHLLEQLSGYDHERVSLGDTSRAIDHNFSRAIEIQARVIALEYDVMDIEGTAVAEMGQFLSVLDYDDRLDRVIGTIEDNRGRWDNPPTPDMGPIDDYDIIDSPPPSIKGLTADGLFKTIKLSWGFNSAIHVAAYELYGSQVPEFIPDSSNLLFRGKTGGYVHNAGTNEQWYFVGRTMNTHGEYSDFSDVVTAQTARIVTDDILFGSVTAGLLADLSVSAKKLAEQAVTSVKLSPGAVTNGKLDDGSVNFSKITNGAVGNVKLADLAVTVGKIVDGAVSNKKLGDLAVSMDKIVDGAISNIKLDNKAVSVEKIVDQAINNAKLGSLSVSYEKLMDNAVIASKLADLSVDATKLADSAVTATKIANLAVGNAAIQNGAITNAKIDNLAVDNAKISDIYADKIVAGSLMVSSANLFSFSRPDQSPGYASRINDTEYISKKSLTVDTISYLRSYTLPVSPGEDIVLSAYFKRMTTGADDFYIRIRFETESAGFAGDVFESMTSYSSEYRKLVAKIKAPATAARMMIEFRNGASGTVTNVNGIMWHRGIVALDYSPHPDDDINAGAITTDKLYSRSVTTSKLATGSVTANEIYARAVTTSKIATGAVTANEIATRTIRSYEMATNTITASSGVIADLAIGNAMIATLAVTSTKIGIAAVGTLAVADAAITTAKIGNLAVGNAQLDYAAVTSAKIANLAVDNAKIASVDASKINANELSAISANLGKVTAGLVDGVELVSKSPSVGGSVIFNGTTIRAGKAYSQNISTRDSTYNTEEGGELSTGSLRIYRDRITKSTGYALREQGISLYADAMYVTHGEKFEFAGLNNRYFEFKVGASNSPLSIASGGTSVLKFFANGVSGSETVTMEALRDIEFRSKSSTGSVTFSGIKTNFNVGPYGMNVLSIGSSGNAGDPTVVFQKELASRFAFDGDVEMQNHDITGINSLRINDPGSNEGLHFENGNGFKIVECPVDGGNGSGELAMWRSGVISLGVGHDSRGTFIRSYPIYNRTYDSSNVYVTSNGVLGRASSATKYKLNIQSIEDEESLSEKVLELPLRMWFNKSACENYADDLTNKTEIDPSDDVQPITPVYGLIAEEVRDIGLDMYTHYKLDENGEKEIEGIAYEKLWTLLIPIVKKDRKRIVELEAENKGLQSRLNAVEARLNNIGA
ncbi:phage tail spike protein [Rossellomorea marisflavi]|uniref:phage tail spike protein n=1 Tax=Rossellomorea marisflavi TaxID=189381 RepID=UPI002079F221|nr:phage tail spike protein [Rossellomorea marisflavi]USK91491.1 phage tail protein [Rossellomorea marisflavi]